MWQIESVAKDGHKKVDQYFAVPVVNDSAFLHAVCKQSGTEASLWSGVVCFVNAHGAEIKQEQKKSEKGSFSAATRDVITAHLKARGAVVPKLPTMVGQYVSYVAAYINAVEKSKLSTDEQKANATATLIGQETDDKGNKVSGAMPQAYLRKATDFYKGVDTLEQEKQKARDKFTKALAALELLGLVREAMPLMVAAADREQAIEFATMDAQSKVSTSE
jgi:hypothetical protein